MATILCMSDWWETFDPVFDGPVTLYAQVADYIEQRIATGTLARGAKLPAERELATHLGVSYDTIRRATAVLRERGLIATVQGRGTFVK
jgi:GntR family transcriptional regulator